MMSATVEPQTEDRAEASSRRLFRLRPGMWIAVALVFGAQLALLFWLGNTPLVKPLPTAVSPVIHLAASDSRELLALQDPTLFVLPHRNNSSGAAWLKMPVENFTPTNWTEPSRPLSLSPERLGAAFTAFMQTNLPPHYRPEMDSGLVEVQPTPMESVVTHSELRIEGDLARLRLLTRIHLPPQTNSDLLANTVVQLLVDARGNPFSPVILAKSGNGDADAQALAFAKALRFAPAQAADLGTVPQDKMTMGRLTFEWQTVAPLATNAPTSVP
ncbi:MAG TPA: hypothetical protein VH597_06410 [Verrucomicrobiae bacterium]|jgi:hypothetical protein|nr:hypothetical protein [Verrucomicrobiae bacterium]